MRRLLALWGCGLLLFSCGLFGLVSCSLFFPTTGEQPEACATLVLIYMAGDNSLSDAVLDDFFELRAATPSGEALVLLLADRCAEAADEDWDEARLFELRYRNGLSSETELDCPELGLTVAWNDDSLDMGDSGTLRAFLAFAARRYDPDRCELVLWNHGGGWKTEGIAARGICSDDETGNVLSLAGLREAIRGSGIGHFGMVILDACSMASIEVASAFRNVAERIVFSQGLVPGAGMPYDKILPIIVDGEDDDTTARKVAEAYVATYEGLEEVTISTLRIDAESALDRLVAAFAGLLAEADLPQSLAQNRAYAREYDAMTVDMGIFESESGRLAEAIGDCRLYRYPETLSGLSIYFPEYLSYDSLAAQYTVELQPFVASCPAYRSFLEGYLQTGRVCTDGYEPNNEEEAAWPLKAPLDIGSKIWCAADEDWYEVYIPSTGLGEVAMNPPEYADYDLAVHIDRGNGSQRELRRSTNPQGTDRVELDDLPIGTRLLVQVFSSQGSYDQEHEYRLVFAE